MPARIVVAGGSGFLGRALTAALAQNGHDVVVLSRGSSAGPYRTVQWNPDGTRGAWASTIDGAYAVVNLSGESIAGKRWSDAQKSRILDSRVQATRSIVAAIRSAVTPPAVLISGSAVGYYGSRGDETLTETASAGADFLADVCVRWESEASIASSERTRVVFLRTGLVLDRNGGALPPMLPPFIFGVGGPVGSGQQYWPWIHLADWVALVRWAIEASSVSGPMNATAPNPVTNREFASSLGKAMRRPAFMPAPAFALRLLLGEMADALILSGQRALPERAQRGGFAFRYSRLDDALRALFT
jgi:uncharacterized protein (TIGR01777 family)